MVAASAVRRSGLETILSGASHSGPVSVIGSLTHLDSLYSQLRQIEPDVVLFDLPHADPQFLPSIRALPPHFTAIVVLIDDPDTRWSATALRSGVQAILPRESSPQEIATAIRASHFGLVLLEPELAADLAARVRSQTEKPAPELLGELTAREIEVLRLLAEGAANKEIAQQLGISDHTAKFHISSILGKLGATSRTEAVTLGIRMGLITL